KYCQPNKHSQFYPFQDSPIMSTNMIINCSGCRTSLQLPPGAGYIRCALCNFVTLLSYLRAVPSPSSTLAPPNPHGRKKAVIIGISYRFSRHELKGCINDANCMRYFLINKFNFPEPSIIMLTEPSPSSSTEYPGHV
ncbi:hypothetical protein Lal_00032674, partial [Lupinus albus]